MNTTDLQKAQAIATLGNQCAALTSYLPKSYKAIQRECEELVLRQIAEDSNIPPLDRLYILQNMKSIIKHAQNQCNILEIADRYLSSSENDNDSTLDEEWFDLFLEECKTVSNEEIQEIWGRILAEECQNPNSIRKRFFMTLKTIDRETALAFSKINNYVVSIQSLDEIYENTIIIDTFDLPKDISLSDIDELIYAGLMDIDISERGIEFENNNTYATIIYHDVSINVDLIDSRLPIGHLYFTPDGVLLSNIINSVKSEDYLDYIVSFYNKFHYSSEIK